MPAVTDDWHDRIAAKLGVAAVVGMFLIETVSNGVFGYRVGGGPLLAGCVFLAFFGACMGLGIRKALAPPVDTSGRIWAGLMIVPFLACFALSQAAGWAVFSQLLADGRVRMGVEATGGKVARGELARLEARQKLLGIQRPASSIEPEEKHECARRSQSYKDGVGPACTKLRAELALAREAESLPGKIKAALGDVGKAPKVADGDAMLGVAKRMFSAEADDLTFWFVIGFVALMGFVANFGPALVFASDHPRPPGADVHPFGGYGAGGYPGPDGGPGGGGGGGGLRRDTVQDVMGYAVRALPPPGPSQFAALPAGGPVGGGSYAMHGAPINIHLSAAGPLAPPHAVDQPATQHLTASPVPARAVPPPRRDIAAISADAPPVDRSRIQRGLAPAEIEAGDVLLAFEAACLVPMPGSMITADDLYRRYQAWAGPRALSAAVFGRLFGDVTGYEAEPIGSAMHYRGVALKAGVQVKAVA